MRIELAREIFEWLKKADEAEVRRILSKMTPNDLLALDTMFELWAHESQLPPPGQGWRVWLMMAGRGFGKTRAGAEWINGIANVRPGVRIALVGASIAEARSIMVEGVSGLITVAGSYGRRLGWEPSLGRLTWPNGSEASLFSGDHADSLRGPEHDAVWCDELAKWRQAEAAWDNLQMGLRKGTRPRALVTTTPRSIQLLKRIGGDPWTVTTRGKTTDNVSLDEKFLGVMTATYGGTRLGRQELDGEYLEDVEGALWPREVIERCRVLPLHHPADGFPPRGKLGEEFDRIVVGVDPPAGPSTSSGQARGGDACGIVVAGSRG